jgi:hypothetical protein
MRPPYWIFNENQTLLGANAPVTSNSNDFEEAIKRKSGIQLH